MLKTLMLILLALCSSAASAEKEEIAPTRDEQQVTVVLHLWDSPRQLVHACQALGAWPGWKTERVLAVVPAPGCNAFDPNTKVCTINTLRPTFVEDADRIENAGHELLHCFLGAYHKQVGG